jgi:hypothetical protein
MIIISCHIPLLYSMNIGRSQPDKFAHARLAGAADTATCARTRRDAARRGLLDPDCRRAELR